MTQLRDKRKPGHCWQDNELYDVFQPLIGPIATHVYAVLTRFAYGQPRIKGKSVRDVAEASAVGKSTVARALIDMEKFGMLVRVGGGGTESAAYDLTDLKDAAVALGAVWDPACNSFTLPQARIAEFHQHNGTPPVLKEYPRAKLISPGVYEIPGGIRLGPGGEYLGQRGVTSPPSRRRRRA